MGSTASLRECVTETQVCSHHRFSLPATRLVPTMGKRGGLLRAARKDAKRDERKKGGGGGKITKKKVKAGSVSEIAATAATSAMKDNDMFAMALPAKLSGRGKKRFEAEMVDDVPAFVDHEKQDLFQQVLNAAKNAAPTNLIGADAHRARSEELKRQKLERQRLKAERFAAHKKC